MCFTSFAIIHLSFLKMQQLHFYYDAPVLQHIPRYFFIQYMDRMQLFITVGSFLFYLLINLIILFKNYLWMYKENVYAQHFHRRL